MEVTGEVFEQINAKGFLNRANTGQYVNIEFDTYVAGKGKEEEIESIETSLHYYEAGDGEPLILVHGIGQTSYTWRNNYAALAKHFHVYALDLPGHGFSGRPQMSYSIEEFALAIEAFMNAMRIEKAHFCAFGESAAYVLDFASHNIKRTGKLVFISPMLSSGGRIKTRGVPSLFGGLTQRMMLSKALVRAALEDSYFDRTLITDQVVDEYYEAIFDKDYKMIAKLCMANFYDEEVVEAVPNITSPMLVVLGYEDSISGGKDNTFLTLGIEYGSALSVRNCGFLVHEEKSEKVSAAIIAFLEAD